jgi:hypothetical protein
MWGELVVFLATLQRWKYTEDGCEFEEVVLTRLHGWAVQAVEEDMVRAGRQEARDTKGVRENHGAAECQRGMLTSFAKPAKRREEDRGAWKRA